MRYKRVRRMGLIAAVLTAAHAAFGGTAFGLDVVTPPPNTLWKFLGIPQGVQRVRDGLSNRFGNRPGLERRPPVRPLAHPANLESQNPAIKRAAEIKFQEDLAPQKIKAVKYLAQIGCGCYDKDGSVTAALVAALDDCTPRVREATIEAITEATREGACTTCNQQCCCNEDLVKKLYEIAYEKDDEGCWVEPSAEIRQAAREAMMACCQGRGPEGPIYEEPLPGTPPPPVRPILPEERPTRPGLPEEPPGVLDLPEEGTNPARKKRPPLPPQDDAAPPPPFGSSGAAVFEEWSGDEFSPDAQPALQEAEDNPETHGPYGLPTDFDAAANVESSADQSEGIVKLVEFAEAAPASLPHATATRPVAAGPAADANGFSHAESAPTRRVAAGAISLGARGSVASIDARNGLVHVYFENGYAAPLGARMIVYHEYLAGRTRLGYLHVIQSHKGAAVARPVDGTLFQNIRRGDDVVYTPGR